MNKSLLNKLTELSQAQLIAREINYILGNSVSNCRCRCHYDGKVVLKNISLTLLILLCCSCQHKQPSESPIAEEAQDVSSCVEIELGNNLKDSGEKMLFSDLVEDVEFVKLETTNASLLGNICKILLFNDHLFIQTMGVDNSNALISVFDRNGKFIRKIGRIGQGPGEYRLARDIAVNDSLLFINVNWLRKIMVYNWHTGKFVKDIPISREVECISSLEDNCIALYPGSPSTPKREKDKNFFSAVVLSYDGKEKLIRNKTILETDESCVDQYINYTTFSSPYLYQNTSNYYDDINDTIYAIKPNEIRPVYHINKGEYKMPICDYFVGKKYFSEGYAYIHGMTFLETSSSFCMDFSYRRRKWIARYDKANGALTCWAQEARIERGGDHIVYGGGFYNDVLGGAAPIWRTLDGGKYIFNIINQGNLDNWPLEKLKSASVKFPEKRDQLVKLLEEYGEDDNPIIVLYKLK